MAIAGIGLLGLAWTLPATAITPPGNVLFRADRYLPSRNEVALTFDDGPDIALGAFLDLLARFGATATFFLVGEQVERDPVAVRAIAAAGHEIAVHCYRHRHHLRLPPWQVTNDMRCARIVIEDAAGRPVSLFRPPYGVFSLSSWRECSRQGWGRVLWSRWGRDWDAGATPQSILNRLGWPTAGDILLLHDSDRYGAPNSQRQTLGALPLLFERLAESNLRARSVGEMSTAARCPANGPHPGPADPPSPSIGRGSKAFLS